MSFGWMRITLFCSSDDQFSSRLVQRKIYTLNSFFLTTIRRKNERHWTWQWLSQSRRWINSSTCAVFGQTVGDGFSLARVLATSPSPTFVSDRKPVFKIASKCFKLFFSSDKIRGKLMIVIHFYEWCFFDMIEGETRISNREILTRSRFVAVLRDKINFSLIFIDLHLFTQSSSRKSCEIKYHSVLYRFVQDLRRRFRRKRKWRN